MGGQQNVLQKVNGIYESCQKWFLKDIASSLISTMNGNVFLANLTMDAMRDQRKNMFKNTYIERFSICGNIYRYIR